MKSIGKILQQYPCQNHSYFRQLLSAQGQLAILQAPDTNIWATLISILSMLTPHMEVLHKELAFVETLMKKDPHLSTHKGLVNLVVKITIQIKSFEVACDN